MAKVLNLGKVVGSNGKDATINGQNAITLDGSNGITVMTESDGMVTVDGNNIKTELTTHTSNTNIHVTAEEKAAWNGKAELTDIPTTLPANGGNADTLGNIPASELERVRTAILGGEAMGLQWTAMQAKKDDTMIRAQVDADFDRVFLFKSIDGGVTWTEIPLGNADTVGGKHANDFAHMRGDIADCNDAIAFGTYNIIPETKNAPTANYYHLVVEPAASGAWIKQTAVLCDSTASLIYSYTRININGAWSDWISLCANAMAANHQMVHVLKTATDVLDWASTDDCPLNHNTKVRVFNSPTSPYGDGTNESASDFIYDIFKIDNHDWMTVIAYDVRSNDVYVNSKTNGTWSGWKNIADGGNAAIANFAKYSDYAGGSVQPTASNICLRNMSSGTAEATWDTATGTGNCPVGAWYGKHS